VRRNEVMRSDKSTVHRMRKPPLGSAVENMQPDWLWFARLRWCRHPGLIRMLRSTWTGMFAVRNARPCDRASVVRSCVFVSLPVFGLAAPLEAQRVTGRIIDAATGERVSTAQIALLDQDGARVRVGVSDSAGYFQLEARRPAAYRLRAERIGYGDYTSVEVDLKAGETVSVVIRLTARGIPLKPLEVRARGGDERGQDGFERRRAHGKGIFLTVDSIRARRPAVVSDAFYGIPGVHVFEGLGSVRLISMYGGKCFVMFVDHMPRGTLVGTMPDLRQPLGMPDDEGVVNRWLKVEWIKGIEVYRDISEVPRELRTASRLADLYPTPGPLMGRSSGGRIRNEACGMIWIWTDIGW
jgi:hypothetical protein